MAALDFPTSPTTGQVFAPVGGAAWTWNGTRWALASQSTGAKGRVGFAQIVVADPATIGGTIVDIGGLTTTFTAVAGRVYRASVVAMLQSTVNLDIGWVGIVKDSTIIGGSQTIVPSASPAGITPSVVFTADGPVTVKVRCVRAAGTGLLTFYATSSYPAQLLVEDITYEAGGGGAVSTWTPLTLINSWTNFGGTRAPSSAYRMVGDNVEVRLAVKSGSSATVITYLPAGYRPPYVLDFIGRDTAPVIFNIGTAGDIIWYGQTANNALVTLNTTFSVTP